MAQEELEIIQQNEEKKPFKDKLKLTLSGLSGSFMFPIATLAIVSIFLSIGGMLESLAGEAGWNSIGRAIKSMALPILQTLPLLFCIAFAVTFCKNDLTCIWNVIIAYLVFISVQGAFIFKDHSQGYTVLFPGAGRDAKLLHNLIDTTLGFRALNTSIFGSLLIGGVVMPYIQKNWFNVNLPGPLAFFSGKRFVPFVSSVAGFCMAIIFLLFWPWIGIGMSIAGNAISKYGYGVDSFLFGIVEKSTIPFGLHHMFYSPLWFSPLGGDLIGAINAHSSTIAAPLSELQKSAALPQAMWQGDSFMGASILSLKSNTVNNTPVFEFIQNTLGLKIGRFTQGKYSVMQFGLPAAALAMIHMADDKKAAKQILIPGILSSALMGITEPIEFSFLFIAPKLFYCFHAVMCGVSFAAMNLLGAHVPSIFSGGLIEMTILGIIPVAKGTQFWWYLVVGAALAPIYYIVFRTAIQKWNLQTPGRGEGVSQMPTEEAKEEKTSTSTSASDDSTIPEGVKKLAIALGGWENIEKLSNCASRLRYDIVDKSKVNEAGLKSSGMGVIASNWVGDKHLQIIVGPKAESINNEMLKWKGTSLE